MAPLSTYLAAEYQSYLDAVHHYFFLRSNPNAIAELCHINEHSEAVVGLIEAAGTQGTQYEDLLDLPSYNSTEVADKLDKAINILGEELTAIEKHITPGAFQEHMQNITSAQLQSHETRILTAKTAVAEKHSGWRATYMRLKGMSSEQAAEEYIDKFHTKMQCLTPRTITEAEKKVLRKEGLAIHDKAVPEALNKCQITGVQVTKLAKIYGVVQELLKDRDVAIMSNTTPHQVSKNHDDDGENSNFWNASDADDNDFDDADGDDSLLDQRSGDGFGDGKVSEVKDQDAVEDEQELTNALEGLDIGSTKDRAEEQERREGEKVD